MTRILLALLLIALISAFAWSLWPRRTSQPTWYDSKGNIIVDQSVKSQD